MNVITKRILGGALATAAAGGGYYLTTHNPTTYYVRVDGGTAAQCTGLADAALPSPTASGAACAWSSPMVAFPPPPYGGQPAPRLQATDTLRIGPGHFPIGWSSTTPIAGAENCNSGLARQCGMRLPSGVAVIGAGETLTELYGINGASAIFGVAGTTGVSLSQLEGDDHAACDMHGGSTQCPTIADWVQNIVEGAQVNNFTLDHVNFHGAANECVRIGAVNGLTVTNSRFSGCAEAGFDFDSCNGSGDPACTNSGNLNFTDVEISLNGCTENYPATATPFVCYSQNQGGYGDGLGTGATGGNWTFLRVLVHNNASDGLDLLYHKNGGTIVFDQVIAYGNAGNQLKAMGNVMLRNSIINGLCAYPWATSPVNNETAYPVPPLVMLYDFGGDGACRADGIALSWANLHGAIVMVNNVISGQSGLITTTDETAGDSTNATVFLGNNVLDGNGNYQWPVYNNCRTCGFADLEVVYGLFNYNANPTVTWTSNYIWKVKDDFCPTPVGTNKCNIDPQLTNESTTALNATPLAGSPLLGAGDPTSCALAMLPPGCNIGAVQGGAPPPPVCPPMPAPLTRSQTCPAGFTGAYTQTATYSAAVPQVPPNQCWVIGPYLPAAPPVGACTAIQPPDTYDITVVQAKLGGGNLTHTWTAVTLGQSPEPNLAPLPILHWHFQVGSQPFDFPNASKYTMTQTKHNGPKPTPIPPSPIKK